MKIYKILAIALVTITVTSCGVIKQNTVKSSDVNGPTVIQKPVVVDLDVKEQKVTGTYSDKSSKSIGYVKQMALYDALQKSNADVIVEPRYVVTKTFRKIDVTVTGYPATYKNFRPMEVQDTLFISPNVSESKINGGFSIVKKGNVKKIAAIGGGSAAVLGGLFFLWLFLF